MDIIVNPMQHQPSPCCVAARMPSSAPTLSATSVPQPARAANGSVEGMALVPGGEFLMGTEDPGGFPADGEGPVRSVHVNSFYIDTCAVTNTEFEQFARETGYRTDAERFGWSFVFHMFVGAKARRTAEQAAAEAPWWWVINGAYWRRPEGPGSNLKQRWNHPCDAHLVERRHRILRMGRQAPAYRSRVGICCAWRTVTEEIRMGRRPNPRWRAPLQHLAGRVP